MCFMFCFFFYVAFGFVVVVVVVALIECTEHLHSFTSDGIKSEAELTISKHFLRVAG